MKETKKTIQLMALLFLNSRLKSNHTQLNWKHANTYNTFWCSGHSRYKMHKDYSFGDYFLVCFLEDLSKGRKRKLLNVQLYNALHVNSSMEIILNAAKLSIARQSFSGNETHWKQKKFRTDWEVCFLKHGAKHV